MFSVLTFSKLSSFFTFVPFSPLVFFILPPLFPPTHISIFSRVSPHFSHPSLPHALACVAEVLRSVHHGSVLLCVFDSHLLSFLSLTGLTARLKLDWTVTHRATDENKPPVRGPAVKITTPLNHGASATPASSHKQHTNAAASTRCPVSG